MDVFRNNFRGYYKYLLATPGVIFGCSPMHWTDCGVVDDTYGLCHIVWLLDEYPDTQGKFQETIDMDVVTVDRIKTADLVENFNLDMFVPSVRKLIIADAQEGLDPVQIFERRAALMVHEYMGRTFDEVVECNPGIGQAVYKDEAGIEHQICTVQRCSQEDQ